MKEDGRAERFLDSALILDGNGLFVCPAPCSFGGGAPHSKVTGGKVGEARARAHRGLGPAGGAGPGPTRGRSEVTSVICLSSPASPDTSAWSVESPEVYRRRNPAEAKRRQHETHKMHEGERRRDAKGTRAGRAVVVEVDRRSGVRQQAAVRARTRPLGTLFRLKRPRRKHQIPNSAPSPSRTACSCVL